MHINEPADQWYSSLNHGNRKEEKKFHRDRKRGAVGEVEARKKCIGGHSSGITNKIKSSEWQCVVTAVNDMSTTGSSVPEVKKTWSDLKIEAKRRLACHCWSLSATCGRTGKPKATPLDKTKGLHTWGGTLITLHTFVGWNNNMLPEASNSGACMSMGHIKAHLLCALPVCKWGEDPAPQGVATVSCNLNYKPGSNGQNFLQCLACSLFATHTRQDK